MRLAELDPALHGTVGDGVLLFDCPHPGCTHRVRVVISDQPYHERIRRPSAFRITIEPDTWEACEAASPGVNVPDGSHKSHTEKVWQASGSFPDTLTLQPSIDIVEVNEKGEKIWTLCWHGHITNGGVT